MADESGLTNAGSARRGRAQGAKAAKLQAALVELDPGSARWADEFVFGEVWAGDDLPSEERMLVAITALAATGRRNQLRNYLHGALQDGIPSDKLRAALRMLVVYAGFPVAIEAMSELDCGPGRAGAFDVTRRDGRASRRRLARDTSSRAWLANNSAELAVYRHQGCRRHRRGRRARARAAAPAARGRLVALGLAGGGRRARRTRRYSGAVSTTSWRAAGVEIPEAFVILETLGPLLVEFAPRACGRAPAGAIPRAGTELWGQGFSEPEAGSDLAHLPHPRTSPTAASCLTGQKIWTTLGQFAQYAAVLARTGDRRTARTAA